MNTEKSRFKLSTHHQGYIALAIWGVVTALLLRRDVYGIDEQAARSLLLSWSISSDLAHPAVLLGMPDLRILPFLPVGFLQPGSVFAAKVLTVLVLAVTAWLLFGWKSRLAGVENALLATGLLIISPLALSQINSIAPGVYLLAAFAIGAWVDIQYRANPRPFSGWYFTQLLICAFSVSLHPAGLAYPLAMLWSWRTLPQSPKFQKFFLAGIVSVVALILLLRSWWGDFAWFQNPIPSLGTIFSGVSLEDASPYMQWLPGSIVLAATLAVVLTSFHKIWADLTGRTLLAAVVIGLLAGDQSWALIALSLILYFGIPLLTRANENLDGAQHPSTAGGFLQQRGLALLVVFICSTVFMRADKSIYEADHSGMLSAQDELIKTIAMAAEKEFKSREEEDGQLKPARFNVASEWPGRTMIACKCNTFPLPPAEKDAETQLAKLHSITYLVLDPRHTANSNLTRNFANLGGRVETASLQPGGVILHVVEATPAQPEGEKSK